MANLLLLVHRLPYPPDKGDKVRSYHLLRHLSARHRVFLGTFIDDPADTAHLPAVRTMCADLCALPLRRTRALAGALQALLTGESLSVGYYDDKAMRRWIAATLQQQTIDAAVVFSSAVAPYAMSVAGLPMLLDLVDVDSAKWARYAQATSGPKAWLYRLEGHRLLAFEREAVRRSSGAWLTTEPECALFERLAPDCAGRVSALGNGVDADYFAPTPDRPSPFAPDERALVFTGAMDYLPNVDAVRWFVQHILPRLRSGRRDVRFHVVGRNPTAEVRALAGDSVTVTGTVPDVRPYLQHSAAVTVPLRIARGIQNKLLEAMAMGRPVVATQECLAALGPLPHMAAQGAATAEDHVRHLTAVLDSAPLADAMGRAARQFVLDRFGWNGRFQPMDQALESVNGQR